jgi:ketosteroid isomerase-like protein
MAATTEQKSPSGDGTTGRGAPTWYEEFYAGLDAKDLTVVDRLCTPDTTMRMANHDMDTGRDAVRAGTAHFFTMIGGMRHTFVKVVEDGDSAYLEAIVEYTRLDGSTVSIPVSTAIDRRDGLIAAQRVYIDLGPLFDAGPL